jgi:hypothetical protein
VRHYDDLVFHPGGYVGRVIGWCPDPGEIERRIDMRSTVNDSEVPWWSHYYGIDSVVRDGVTRYRTPVEPWRISLREYVNEIRKEREGGQ